MASIFKMNAHTIQHQHFNELELPCVYSDKAICQYMREEYRNSKVSGAQGRALNIRIH